MSVLRRFVFLLCVAIASCTMVPQVEEGVSRSLAEFRSNTISNLQYRLFFNIPLQRDSAVRGRVTILFNTTSKELPQIDFKAPPGAIVSVRLGTEKVAYSFEKEHIVIDKKGISRILGQQRGESDGGKKSDSGDESDGRTISDDRAKSDSGNNIDGGQISITVDFICPDQSLNRREDMLYTLLVPDRARTLFPCFDQPDLKARYTLELDIPNDWTAVSNTSCVEKSYISPNCSWTETDTAVLPLLRQHLTFRESEPLSTYLFSFVAGVFEKAITSRNGMEINMYHRENDPEKLAQIPDIFDEVFTSVEWLEEYTGIKYPFEKYDFIVLPGFQYGGMEHTGATLYNDTRIFLDKGAGIKEAIGRYQLITHETAHMWFGDLVTMKWFDDVWTKEVFANYFAAIMTAEKYPDVDQSMSFVDYAKGAYWVDRTPGANPIKQPLDNLRNAGLVYGNIIYDKSPIVMDMLVRKTGPELFRSGIQKYLNTFAYGNATWEQLIEILDNEYRDEKGKENWRSGSKSLKEWSRAWVESAGMPEIECKIIGSETNRNYIKHKISLKNNNTINKLVVSQKDPLNRGLTWQQNISLLLVGIEKDAFAPDTVSIDVVSTNYSTYSSLTQKGIFVCDTIYVDFQDDDVVVDLDRFDRDWLLYVIPNIDSKAYGYFKMDEATLDFCMKRVLGGDMLSSTEKASTLINIHENYLRNNLDPATYGAFLLDYLDLENDPLLFSQALGYLGRVNLYDGVDCFDRRLWVLAQTKNPEVCSRNAFAALLSGVKDSSIVSELYKIFIGTKPFNRFPLTEQNYTSLAYELAVRLPEEADDIIALGREKITNADRLARYDFVSKAVSSDEAALDDCFQELLDSQNRRIEPWASGALRYLNHPLRAERSRKYIRPALDILQEIQVTGDIFFPTNWLSALLSGHPEEEAQQIIRQFLEENPDYPPMLKLKILQNIEY